MVNYPGTLDATFAALADPTRRAILARLARGESSVTELAGPFDVSLPAISRHLKVLEGAGLLARERDGRVHRCHLVSEPLKEAAAWIGLYRRFWEERFDGLEKYLKKAARKSQDREEHTWSRRRTAVRPRSASSGPSRPGGRTSSAPGRTPRR